ncbi:MAG: hypothetical protein QOI61_1335 [Actinomycetota bacterium]
MSTTTIPLPDRPNLEQLKKRARELQRELQIPLSEAQLHLARGYGFASWPKLKQHVELVTRLTRTPDTVAPSSDPADEFLRLCCLCYSDDDSPAKRAAASAMLTPELATRNIWIAAATSSWSAVMRMLEDDPSLASKEGGPFMWEPLMYLAYARFEPAPSQNDTILTADALLARDANPNAGYLWHGFPSPFTVMTGVFGEGEQGPVNQSRHPHWMALARLLLGAGADPNDAQVLYNRQFEPGAEHLELLFEFGLGQGDGGPWKKMLTSAREAPSEMLRAQLRWAIHHDMRDRVRLLAENGVDLTTPFDDERFGHCHGRTPAQFAALCGNAVIVKTLAAHGAVSAPLSDVDGFIGALMTGDSDEIARFPEADYPDIAQRARQERPSLIVQAAAAGRPKAVEAAVMAGFDINALGRADSPCEMPWQTALHVAVEQNNEQMVDLLLTLGADPSITDARFNATPAGWAEHFGYVVRL